jgi:DNA-binding NarL/FixJ family response regulator
MRGSVNVVGEATKANELLSQVEKARSVVVLLDWKLPGLQIGDVVTALRNARRNLKLVVLGDSEALRGDALAAGADAFLSTDEPVEWLLKTLYRVSGLSQSFAG